MDTKQTILVTGLSGMVGTRFQELYGDQYELINLDLTTGIDITNAESVEKVFAEHRATAVIHLAAFTNLAAAAEQQDDKEGVCYKVNVLGTKTIAQAAARHHVHMIHISTDYVFDGNKNEPYTETDIPRPIEWYGETKYLAEEEVEKSGAMYTMLRMAFPYQARPMRPDFIQKMMGLLETNTLYPVFGDHVITPTFVDDVAHVFDYCIKKQPSGLFHMTGSSSHTDYEIALMVKEIFGYAGDVKEGSLTKYLETAKRPYQRSMRLSNKKLTTEFGLTIKTLREGLNEMKVQLGK